MHTDHLEIELALQRVGELLEAEGAHYTIAVVGGAALSLLGLVARSTSDVDIIAFGRGDGGELALLHEPPKPLPQPLVRAAELVARDMSLVPGWLNTETSAQWKFGLPPGLNERLVWRQFAALRVGIVAKYDLIFLKLFAAIDQGPSSVHYRDLLTLAPNPEELAAAASWVATQDASADFAADLAERVATLSKTLGHSDGNASRS